MKIVRQIFSCVQSPGMEANHEPLYKRLPTHDEHGNYLSDFMMLIPGLKKLPAADFEARLSLLHALLGANDDVVFADLNTPLNLLWVSVKSRHGVINELAAEIIARIPEARLVGHPTIAAPSSPRDSRRGIEKPGGRRLDSDNGPGK